MSTDDRSMAIERPEDCGCGQGASCRFLYFVVDFLYDLIDADHRGLDETYSTEEQIDWLRKTFHQTEETDGRYRLRRKNGSCDSPGGDRA